MNIFDTPCQAAGPRLHVFQQEGGWHWGITIERSTGGGFKVIAYSEHTFPDEDEAQNDGDRALVNLSDLS
ncbi:hypothetical protein [Paraburkholderia sp. J41]|uniref:hypothetical protein n=1 Tax=Paraburkholderia sp. J41 TaxID=2805433 RepID=UPI002AC36EA7|nr:hypothetical protein [Paraburkholderia sp. J41]